MKKLNNFWFGVSLTLAILFVVLCFEYADNMRNYNALGSEVFTIALPLMIVKNKLNTSGRKKQQK